MQGMKPYSEDLPTRIVKAVEEGMSKSGAARLFDVSLSSVKRYVRSVYRPAVAKEDGLRPKKRSVGALWNGTNGRESGLEDDGRWED